MNTWWDDIKWAVAMMRARRHRRTLIFSGRKFFDDELRPHSNGDPLVVVAYPDAIYYVTTKDVNRAITFTSLIRQRKWT